MFYIVECSYSDPESEERWNDFYSLVKLPLLISVSGFITSQRFKALTPNCPVYLAIHTIKSAEVICSEEYKQKGGGSFSSWQQYIYDWHRNLYECEDIAPAVSKHEVLIIVTKNIEFIEEELGYRPWVMRTACSDKSPELQVAYVIPRTQVRLFSKIPGRCIYEPVMMQLQNLSDL
jgi:hypothetical protein